MPWGRTPDKMIWVIKNYNSFYSRVSIIVYFLLYAFL